MLRLARWTICSLSVLFLVIFLTAQEKGTGYLKVKAQPGRAGVFVDGKYLGPAANFHISRKYAVSAGEHELSLRDPRYEDFTTKVTVQSGKTTVVSHSLQSIPLIKPPYGAMKTTGGSKYDAVYVNGKYMGHLDEFNGPNQKLLLNPGEYEVKIVPSSGGQAHEEKIKIEAGRTVIVHAK
jgi:hypothetical protein